MLNLKYANQLSSAHKLSLLQRHVYAGLLIGLKWLQERSHDLAVATNHIAAFEKVSIIVLTMKEHFDGKPS